MRKLKLYKNKYYLVFYKVDILTLEISWPLAVLSNVAELVRFFELPETPAFFELPETPAEIKKMKDRLYRSLKVNNSKHIIRINHTTYKVYLIRGIKSGVKTKAH